MILNEIKLTIEDKNLNTIINILENLKDGLINNLEVNEKNKKSKVPQYRGKVNTIIKEEESGTNDKSGKYASPSAYKQKLHNKK